MCDVAIVGVEWDLVDLIESNPDLKLVGFIDFSKDLDFHNLPYLGKDSDWEEIKKERPNLKVILGMDPYLVRLRITKHYGKAAELTVVSPDAYISPRASIGKGTLIQRGVKVMPRAKIGDSCKINVNATIHHESQVGDYCSLAPGCQILGRVIIEEGVYVGAGAVIRQNCRVGKGAFIGAGAVVVKDVPPNLTVVGVPAKELKRSPLKL